MEKVLILSCLAAVGYAIFFPLIQFPNQQQSMRNICIYSNNPARYQPKCFLCPNGVYPGVLQACVSAAAIPSNVSYTQAACIEQNCMIRRGRRSVDDIRSNLLEEEHRPSAPSVDQVVEQSGEEALDQGNELKVVGTEEIYATDYVDYEDSEQLDQD